MLETITASLKQCRSLARSYPQYQYFAAHEKVSLIPHCLRTTSFKPLWCSAFWSWMVPRQPLATRTTGSIYSHSEAPRRHASAQDEQRLVPRAGQIKSMDGIQQNHHTASYSNTAPRPNSTASERVVVLDAPVISSAVAKLQGQNEAIVLTTQARSPCFYTITNAGINARKTICELKETVLKETITSVCALDGRVFFTTIKAIYELVPEKSYDTRRLCKSVPLYSAAHLPLPLRNSRTVKCGRDITLVVSFGIPERDPAKAGLIVLMVGRKTPSATILYLPVSTTTPHVLHYDQQSALLHIALATLYSEVHMVYFSFKDPGSLSPALQGMDWFTQTDSEFYSFNLLLPNITECMSQHLEEHEHTPGFANLHVKVLFFCGSALVITTAFSAFTPSIDLPFIIVIEGLCGVSPTLSVLNINLPSVADTDIRDLSICSITALDNVSDRLYLVGIRNACLFISEVFTSKQPEQCMQVPLYRDVCKIYPPSNCICHTFEMNGSLQCLFTSVVQTRVVLRMVDMKVGNAQRTEEKSVRRLKREKTDQGARPKGIRIRMNSVNGANNANSDNIS